MDAPQRTGYRARVRRPAVPRALLLATAGASVLLAAGGYFAGRSLGTERTPVSAPLVEAPAPAAGDPIVIPEPLEIP